MKLLFAIFLFTLSAPADQLMTDKTARMTAIEYDYNLRISGVLRVGKLDYWVFMEAEPTGVYGRYPVVVKENANDHDVEVAIVAAENCAAFYETELKRTAEKKEP